MNPSFAEHLVISGRESTLMSNAHERSRKRKETVLMETEIANERQAACSADEWKGLSVGLVEVQRVSAATEKVETTSKARARAIKWSYLFLWIIYMYTSIVISYLYICIYI